MAPHWRPACTSDLGANAPTPCRFAVASRMKARRIPDELVGSSGSGSDHLAAEPQVRLNLLPTFQLEIDGEGARFQTGAQRLLAYLALQDGPVLRASVAGVLWLDSTEEHAHASLRSAIWRLGRCGVPLIVADRDTLGL